MIFLTNLNELDERKIVVLVKVFVPRYLLHVYLKMFVLFVLSDAYIGL